MQTLNLEQRIQVIEDRAALKALVDTFSNLADAKDVKSQVLLFTEDATVDSYVGGALTSSLKGASRSGSGSASSSPPSMRSTITTDSKPWISAATVPPACPIAT